ncbi:MAG: hypothetical protein LH614_15410 [Pyrinomonadaceae bacterium]|nr:hypothetical protein [Pyrinomonadaceae bacterium]
MNSILFANESGQPKSAGKIDSENFESDRNSENYSRQAKVLGTICISNATMAAVFGISSPNSHLFFIAMAATCSFFAYSEIGILSKGKSISILQLLSFAFLILSFIFSISSVKGAPVLIIYGFFSILLQLIMTTFALANSRREIWKSLLPLAIPVLQIVGIITANSKIALFSVLFVPLGWALLGFVAYLGRK